MERESIGELEELILLAVGSEYENAYAVSIVKLIEEYANRNIDVTAVHAVLRRLEKKGLVTSRMGESTAERGGRRKRMFSLTQAGRSVLEHTRTVRNQMYELLPRLSFHS